MFKMISHHKKLQTHLNNGEMAQNHPNLASNFDIDSLSVREKGYNTINYQKNIKISISKF